MSKTADTFLICYTQARFDELEPALSNPEDAPLEDLASTDERELARLVAQHAEQLWAAVQAAGRRAEIVKVPQRSFEPRHIAKAAFGWRLLDLKEVNGQAVDLLICLDFPAWSVAHPRKWVWLQSMPNFISRNRSAIPASALEELAQTDPATGSPLIRLQRSDAQTENARTVAGLLQAERRGLAEARRRLVTEPAIAQELARTGLQSEVQPFPSDSILAPDSPEWQSCIKRLLDYQF